MPSPVSLPTIILLALAGTGSGVYLGKSAIEQIDPVYFSTPFSSSTFHADLAPNPPDWDDFPAPAFEDAALAQGLGSGCVACPQSAEEYAPAFDWMAEDVADLHYAGGPEEVRVEDEEHAEDAEPPMSKARADIQRYAYYRVSEEQEEPQLPGSAKAVTAPVEGANAGCAGGQACAGEAAPGI